MHASNGRSRAKDPEKRPPRRLSRGARREQLIDMAMPLVVEQGLGSFSLDELAAKADVTRNLLYHYFPRGRSDILLAVAERAGNELTSGWLTDESIPLQQRMALNFQRFIEHAMGPSDAWRVRRMGRVSNDPELLSVIVQFEEVVVESISLNNFGTPEPPPLARLAIKGFIAFSETVLDEARGADVPREQVLQMVAQTFASTMRSVSPAQADQA
jgi:AcrR family transcriptional regulator